MTDNDGTATVIGVRSAWGAPVQIPIGDRVTVLVGPNRSGSTSVLFALAAALDPAVEFVPARDMPFQPDATAGPEVRIDLPPTVIRVTWSTDGVRQVEPSTAASSGSVVYCPVESTPAQLVARVAPSLRDRHARQALSSAVLHVARRLIPEITEVDVECGESGCAIRLIDDSGALLPDPQARVPVALGVAMHMADSGDDCALVAIEAPEAFLHPAAQETLAIVLTDMAAAAATRVVVATSSPFAVPRASTTVVVALARDGAGRTIVVGTAPGDRPQSHLLGGLLRDDGFAAVFDRLGRVADGTRAVLIVEGGTDEAYLRHVAEVLGRGEMFEGVLIWPAGGAMGAALTAIVLRAELTVPLLVLLDHDDAGRRARDTLVSRFDFVRQRHLLTYADAIDGVPAGVEAETLFELDFMRQFVATHPQSVSDGERREHGITTVGLTASGKATFIGWMRQHLQMSDAGGWAALLDLIDERLKGIACQESTGAK
ncbi:MAG: TOPRIM nucleotidyl transferase/hydrolase domain-containing protein [Nitriliruptoraceae bacterium]